MKEPWYIIANPTAGHGAVAACLDELCEALQEVGLSYLVRNSDRPNHAITLVEEGIVKGFRKIITVGGDGTNNEVVNGILRQTIIPSTDIQYALLPCGTGNDWVKEYQIPRKIRDWMAMLHGGKTILQDIGKVVYHNLGQQQERYFANVAGMSYDAFVVREMSNLRKPINNRLGYLLYGLYYVFRYRIPHAKIWIDGKVNEGNYYLINAGICRYSGGGMQLVPHAIPNDGKLAVTLAGPLTKLGVLLNSYRFYNGKIAGHPKVEIFQVERIRVEHKDEAILLEVDGEYLGTTPVDIEIIPKALRVLVP
jgi:YegS/Rv2252/BmrU family lipid kinase